MNTTEAHQSPESQPIFELPTAQGVNSSERVLTELCQKTFLRLWSQTNVFTDEGFRDGKGSTRELCDALVIFGDDVIIFSDKHIEFQANRELKVAWPRWYKRAVADSCRQLYGALSWLTRFPQRAFLDPKCTRSLTVPVPASAPKFHLVAVTRGSRDAVLKAAGGEGLGAFALNSSVEGAEHFEQPFVIGLPDPTKKFVHVFDEVAISLVLGELDTAADFLDYLNKREQLLGRRGSVVIAPGEEELLGTYLQTMSADGTQTFSFWPRTPGQSRNCWNWKPRRLNWVCGSKALNDRDTARTSFLSRISSSRSRWSNPTRGLLSQTEVTGRQIETQRRQKSVRKGHGMLRDAAIAERSEKYRDGRAIRNHPRRVDEPAMTNKSTGVTVTERVLADFCERSFLKLWSYPNPYKDDGHELCDLLAVFGNDVFIFFDREAALADDPEKDPQVLWDRWKRNVIDRQVKTAHGAERYIRNDRPIFLDGKRQKQFPFQFDRQAITVHKIIVAHGAKEACERASLQNVYGSLAITYTKSDGGPTAPFHIEIDKRKPVHILDSHNMPIVLSELDTVSDFATYLREKVRAASDLDHLSYCGEEDLLAHYLLNYDNLTKRHVIGSTKEKLNGVMIGEGEWRGFSQSGVYMNTKKEDRISYFWDELIQRTCQNSLDGTLGGNSDILLGQSAIYEMVKEPRFMRRGLADKMLTAVERFPDTGSFTRQVTLLPSFQENVAYVFLQLRVPEPLRSEPDFREKRLAILEIACGAAKNKFPYLVKVIGIGIEAPKFSGGTNAEDFILMPCEGWSAEQRDHYRELNQDWNFFATPDLKRYKDRVTQFVQPPRASRRATDKKIGRNDPCPCGSGKKYKKCHG